MPRTSKNPFRTRVDRLCSIAAGPPGPSSPSALPTATVAAEVDAVPAPRHGRAPSRRCAPHALHDGSLHRSVEKDVQRPGADRRDFGAPAAQPSSCTGAVSRVESAFLHTARGKLDGQSRSSDGERLARRAGRARDRSRRARPPPAKRSSSCATRRRSSTGCAASTTSRTRARHYAFTQFEPNDARRAYPCFDEPGFKVPFEVSITVPKGSMAVSNTKVARQRDERRPPTR